MKNIFSNYLLGKIFGAGLCLFFLAGATPLYAQDDVTEHDGDAEEEVAVKRPVVAKLPTYPMREVKGLVLDAATKAPLAGVRVQSLNDPRFSAMTGEDGKYTLSVPTFETTLYLSTPEYNAIQTAIKEGEQTLELYSSEFNAFYKSSNQVFTKAEASVSNSSAISMETDIENTLNANVLTTMRGGMPGQGANMLINGITCCSRKANCLVIHGVEFVLTPK